jgi:tripartite-type tricarboxylate transporter receptor subunit TctC
MRLHKEITDALRAPDLVEKLINAGMEPAPGTPEELDAFLPKDLEKWAKVIKAANIKFE